MSEAKGQRSEVGETAITIERAVPATVRASRVGRLTADLQTDDFDIVILNAAATALVGRILNCKQVLIDREPFKRHCFESLALRKYMDFSIKETANLKRRYGHRSSSIL